jgi:hypothetical protein
MNLPAKMKTSGVLLLLLISTFSFRLEAQSWAIHINGNETFPIGNELLGQYPILWYSSTEGRGVLVGGFGAGVSYTKPFQETLKIKYQVNGQRSRFYDEPTVFSDFNGQPLGAIIGINTNLNLSAFAMPLLSFLPDKKATFGAGLGLRGVLYSRSNYGTAFVDGMEADLKLHNNSLAPLVLILPVEIAYTAGRFSMATRGEFSVTKTTRLSVRNDRSLAVFVELGFRLGK